MYWGNECLRAAATAALASYEGDMGEFLFGTRRVYPADWVEEQMLWVACRFKKYADCKGAARDWDATYPFEVCMETLLRQIAVYAHVNLPNPIEPREDYVSACTDREFLNQTRQAKRNPTLSKRLPVLTRQCLISRRSSACRFRFVLLVRCITFLNESHCYKQDLRVR